MDFTKIQAGLLVAGTETEFGVIVGIGYTAYEMEDGSYVAFSKIHGTPKPVEPLCGFYV